MRQVRFGSYSIETTVAGTPSLRRLKSIRRYIRLWPPPRNRTQMTPWLLRPPFFLARTRSDFSGFFVLSVRSVKSLTEPWRRPLEVGLYCRMPMVVIPSRRPDRARGRRGSEELDPVFLVKLDDRLLPARQLADAVAVAAVLAGPHLGADVHDAHREQLLDGVFDLGLAGRRVDLEAIGIVPGAVVRALFRDQRPQHDLVRLERQVRPALARRLRLAVGLPQSFRPWSRLHGRPPS